MRLDIPKAVAEALRKRGLEPELLSEEAFRWNDVQTVDSSALTLPEQNGLLKVVSALPRSGDGASTVVNRLRQKLIALEGLNADDTRPVKKLEVMAEAMRMLCLERIPRSWVFSDRFGSSMPWLVTEVTYVPRTVSRYGGVIPACVKMKGTAFSRGKKLEEGWSWELEDLGDDGCTPSELLSKRSIVPATIELIEEHTAEVARYDRVRRALGDQFIATGSGRAMHEDRWSRDGGEKFGAGTKVIVDDDKEWGEESLYIEHELLDPEGSRKEVRRHRSRGDDDGVEAVNRVALPVHPQVRVFSLESHVFRLAFSGSLTEYVYDDKLDAKLILDRDSRHMLDLLVGASLEGSGTGDDIVRGKSGGVSILCYGASGTGKTLTAEVYAEKNHRPLYTVQCSQLGVDVDTLEKNLATVLERASRWRAVLLIDEADVYIHERGSDMVQNAIIGVFLRLLEYYDGILFLTTNREAVVDDAIISRCIAQIAYGAPKDTATKVSLWRVQLVHYGLLPPAKNLPAVKGLIDGLIKAFPSATGRNIKQLCRLVRIKLTKEKTVGEPPKIDDFTWVSQFMPAVDLKP